MKLLLIDTNVYAAFKDGVPAAVDELRRAERIGLCTPVLGELYGGFRYGTQEARNVEELEEFLDTPRVVVFGADETTAQFYAHIHANLRRSGRPIPTNDMWIAATAMQHGFAVCSYDVHFESVDGLMFLRPV